jgi:hypothetical protein
VQKAKVALVEAGIIKSAGRGRISAEGHAWLAKQHNAGTRFSDWPKGEITVTKTEATAEKPAESKVKVIRTASSTGEQTIADIPPYRFPEEDFEAYEFVNGKKKPVGLRECCNTCMVSLVAHQCEDPTYLNNRKVFIVRKK